MRIFTVLAFISISSVSLASTTFQVAIGNVHDASSSNIALGTIGILVADTNSDSSFSGSNAGTYSSIVGTTLSVGSAIGNDTIVGVFQASDALGPGPIGFFDTISATAAANAKLALYWFPGVTTIGAALAANQGQMGFYRSDTPDTAFGGDIAFAMPAVDGNSYTLAYGDSSLATGGSTPQSSLTAFNMVPEPSRVLFLALGGMGFLMRRRRA
jgi:hypothetical protein